MNRILELASSVELSVRPELLRRSHGAYAVRLSPLRTVLVVHSLETAAQSMRGVRWHDEEEREHCRTWSAGCRCDLGDES